MKAIAILTLAVSLCPGIALAQQAPQAGQAQARPDFAAMRQMHDQMKQLHLQARAQMLSALSPAHRALLANIAGQLAISPNPDRAAAARALDAALSQGESRSIMTTATGARTQQRALMEAARTKFEATLSADQRAQMAQRDSERSARPQPRNETAGHELLDTALGGMHGGHEFGPGHG